MEAFGRFVVSLSEVLEFNEATLSGCVDIIVVQQPDGSLKSTPFHARFGKLKVLKSHDKCVKIHVNGLEAIFTMKLGKAGEAFFEEEMIATGYTQNISQDPLILPDNETVQKRDVKTGAGNRLVEKLQLKHTLSNQSTSDTLKGGQTSAGYAMEIENVQQKKIKMRTLRPDSKKLQSLSLKFGCNTITYTVQSMLQGSQTVTGHLYYWPSDANIIISDIDGTITKTDFWGHVMPYFGRDWSQPGIAPLYTNIRRNGYYILYLTARPIGQSLLTKNFLQSLYQEGSMLPHGPLFMSPDRMLNSVKREIVYKRPELFKIAALKDIRSLFPEHHNPFHAGFGNRETDAISYKAVGIPLEKVFIVDPRGDIQHHNSTVAKSYTIINSMIKEIFPGIARHKEKLAKDLNDSNILVTDDNNLLEENTAKVVC